MCAESLEEGVEERSSLISGAKQQDADARRHRWWRHATEPIADRR